MKFRFLRVHFIHIGFVSDHPAAKEIRLTFLDARGIYVYRYIFISTGDTGPGGSTGDTGPGGSAGEIAGCGPGGSDGETKSSGSARETRPGVAARKIGDGAPLVRLGPWALPVRPPTGPVGSVGDTGPGSWCLVLVSWARLID